MAEACGIQLEAEQTMSEAELKLFEEKERTRQSVQAERQRQMNLHSEVADKCKLCVCFWILSIG